MSINKHDDYDKLANLLYPSIEASGSVYYGQTKKLTIDETLDKNDLNFNSHIETFNRDGGYESYFNWKLGPLKGAIRVEALEHTDDMTLQHNFPNDESATRQHVDGSTSTVTQTERLETVFAKYRLTFNSVSNRTTLDSGSYTTYERNIGCKYLGLVITSNFDPVDTSNAFIRNRSFYISNDGHLYIQIADDGNSLAKSDNYDDEVNIPLHFINNSDVSVKIRLKVVGSLSEASYVTCTSDYADTSSWVSYTLGDYITLGTSHGNNVVYIKGHRSSQSSNNRLQFEMETIGAGNSVSVEAHGNINSLLIENNFNSVFDLNQLPYRGNTFRELFKNCTILTRAPILPASIVSYSSYNKMFYGCTSLTSAPELPATILGNNCYDSMFDWCTSLTTPMSILPAEKMCYGCYEFMFYRCASLISAPELPSLYLSDACYKSMFDGCTALNSAPRLYATNLEVGSYGMMFNGCTLINKIFVLYDFSNTSKTSAWLQGTSNSGEYYAPNMAGGIERGNDTIPSEWTAVSNNDFTRNTEFNVKQAIPVDNYKQSTLVTSGSDSDENGRGKLNDDTTLFLMPQNNPFKDGSITTDKYNKHDGSMNQEIWGYKCFNSPVAFRNGIYGECTSITTYCSEFRNYPYDNQCGFQILSTNNNGYGSLINCECATDSSTNDKVAKMKVGLIINAASNATESNITFNCNNEDQTDLVIGNTVYWPDQDNDNVPESDKCNITIRSYASGSSPSRIMLNGNTEIIDGKSLYVGGDTMIGALDNHNTLTVNGGKGDLGGIIPHPVTSSNDIPIGSIFLAYRSFIDLSQYHLKIGDVIDTSNLPVHNTVPLELYVANFNGLEASTPEFTDGTPITYGKYRCLSEASGNESDIVLLIRTE